MNYFFHFILLILSFSLCCSEKNVNTRHNILFIFADDLSYEAIGGLGHPLVKTPNIDRLIKKGTTYSHAYNMGGWNGAICVASRAMLISGRSIWRAQEMAQKWRDQDSLAFTQTWPKLMESAGYDTYMTGKWHVQAKAGSIFQTAANIRPGMPGHLYDFQKVNKYIEEQGYNPKTWSDVMPAGYNRPLSENDNSWSPTDSSFGGFWEGGIHWSEVIANDALGFMDSAQKSSHPFFMYLAFNAPHDHRQSPQKYIDMYPLESIDIPENWLEEYPYKDSIGCSPSLRDEALAPFPRTSLAIKTHLQEYYAIISHMDDQIGKILEKLSISENAENTYIIFTADHGLSVGHHGLIGKQNMYDHSMRVPFTISGPGIPQGKVSPSEIYLQDAMATSLEIAGVEKPDFIDFKSLMNDIKGIDNQASRDPILGYYTNDQRMIRKNGFKLIVYPRVPKLRLFLIDDDPLEMNDLSNEKEHESIIKEMLDELILSQKEMGDNLILDRLDYL